MPNSATAKTKSARSQLFSGVIIAAALGILAAAMVIVRTPASFAVLRVGGQTYHLEMAATPAAQQKGLGGRVAMAHDQGMLFSFDHPALECFWMKDMHFALDIIWLAANQRIGAIEANISPSTYPHTFCPKVSAKYVIELDAGQAAAARLQIGQSLTWQN